MASYLSLAAIENADLLAQHTQPIIDSVISGNMNNEYVEKMYINYVFSLITYLAKAHF